ncbi:hypothetical protein PG985_006831 [Apiospora marii]|uniref:Uncharacterized protein n=1 Tax=Apiospora marii TaxID=335849 RepID=A0ABR1SHK1_9PEZI
MVQNWLAQSTIANQNYPTASEDHAGPGPTNTHQYYDPHEQRQVRSPSLDTRRSAFPQPPEPPFDVGTRLRSPPQGFEHSPKSRKRLLSDSSILSVCKNQRLSPKDRYNASHHARALHGPAPAELSRRLEVIPQGADSDEPASPTLAYRSKKPRNKTRDDKYEHKKDKRRTRKSTEDQQPPKPSKRKKEDKTRTMTSSKNVMSNWASKAVLNDRITVQQPIKPGIFQNGREANKKPVQDLVFSDMHFLQERTGNAGPKPLSERRLRELEKQQKEMKEVSSFFLPAQAPREVLETDVGDQRGHNREILRKLQERSGSATRRYSTSKSSQSEPSASREYLLSEQVLQRRRDSDSSAQNIEEDRRSQGDCHRPVSSRDSRPTTYFSWSTSPSRSPIRKNGSVSQASSGIHDGRTTTPETVRRALVDSGIFRGTGIAPYDQERSITDEEQGGSESSTNDHAPSEDDMGRHDLQRRLETLLPPSWRVDRSQTTQKPSHKPRLSDEDDPGFARDPTQKQQHQHLHATVGDNRKDIAESAKITVRNEHVTQERPDEGRDPRRRVGLDEDTNHHTACLVSPDNDDRISIASRDLMPPPPLPDHVLQPRLGGAVQKPPATGPDTRYLPTNKELSAAAHMMAQHDVAHKNGHSEAPSETSPGISTRSSSQYGLIAPLQSASWVTPSPKPRTPALTTDTNTSRSSPNSFYDVNHPAGKGSLPTITQVRSAQRQESMAEFIARIEREADVIPPTSMNEQHNARENVSPIPDTGFMGCEDEDIEPADFGNVYDRDMSSLSSGLHENQPLYLPHSQSSCWMDGGQFTNGELEKVVHLAEYECPPGESNYHGSAEDRLRLPDPLNQRGLCADQACEMSSFWGPNNFL